MSAPARIRIEMDMYRPTLTRPEDRVAATSDP